MSGARLRFILGGATLGALLGALYANHLFNQQHGSDTNNNGDDAPEQISPDDPLRAYKVSETASEPVPVGKE